MYSRYQDHSKRPVRLPEHYGGSAFSQKPTEPITVSKREPAKSFAKNGVEEKASPVADRLLRAEVSQEEVVERSSTLETLPVVETENTKDEDLLQTAAMEKPSAPSPFNFEGLRRLLGGAQGEGDQDRLLLLGLILLLSRTEGDSDILLWLSLLLLCG